MFYLSCPSAPLTINLRQCHYHHCHHQCYISVVIVFASAMINLNMIYWTWTRFGISWHPLYWPTWKGWFIDFRAKAPLASRSFYSPRQGPAMEHYCCWCCWTRSDQPDFVSHFGTKVCGNLAWALRVRYTGRYGRIPPVTPIIRKERISTFFNDYFHFYGERG